MKYILNKKIFYINLLLCFLLVGTIVYFEGIKVVRSRTETINCPIDSPNTCHFVTGEGKNLYLEKGEEITINKFNQKNLNIANYGVWIIMSIAIIINHIKYNKKYKIKKKK
ncbi:unnamed protein product [marine sediment metagenome]|uniref:Uncharacterized protein n=1 Tax=marine sediment metagenome TaxID=412755 RepID=X1DDP4_9ZZZZ